MPSINGITAIIETHDGPLEEYGHDEFPGGTSCYIAAHSGQQFWLTYALVQQIPAKAASVEFYVDGHKVDAQCPVSTTNSETPTIGPMESSIKSQYGKEPTGEIWRRDVFFTLLDVVKQRPCGAFLGEHHQAENYGTIECKVFRAEKTEEWTGTVQPDTFGPTQVYKGSLKSKDISHTARLGAKIEAASAMRYSVRNIDPEDAPFAWFKFFYRSKRCLESLGYGPFADASMTGPSRSISRKASIYANLAKHNVTPATNSEYEVKCDLGNEIPTPAEEWVKEAFKAAEALEALVSRIGDCPTPDRNPEQSERLHCVLDKFKKLKKNKCSESEKCVHVVHPDEARGSVNADGTDELPHIDFDFDESECSLEHAMEG
ncbi:hypothetical protein RUND412_001856 [Rhizina undulata]